MDAGHLIDDLALAEQLARDAGELLLTLRDGSLTGRELGDRGDADANRQILTTLAALRPDDGILSEESRDDGARLQKQRVWIIDPLDGTREYREARNDWAVHVALAIDGIATVGAVALPGRGLVLSSADSSRPDAASARPRMVVSRSRPPEEATRVAEALKAEVIPLGSAGAKAMAVVLGEADIYLHAGGQYEWDNCAPVAVALAHGLHCSRLDGLPLTYNQANPWSPDLLICRRDLAEPILAALRD